MSLKQAPCEEHGRSIRTTVGKIILGVLAFSSLIILCTWGIVSCDGKAKSEYASTIATTVRSNITEKPIEEDIIEKPKNICTYLWEGGVWYEPGVLKIVYDLDIIAKVEEKGNCTKGGYSLILSYMDPETEKKIFRIYNNMDKKSLEHFEVGNIIEPGAEIGYAGFKHRFHYSDLTGAVYYGKKN
jgi:hypothetical protein